MPQFKGLQSHSTRTAHDSKQLVSGAHLDGVQCPGCCSEHISLGIVAINSKRSGRQET